MTKPGRSDREKLRREVDRELQWSTNRMPRRDEAYRQAMAAAVMEYEAWMQELRDEKVQRRLRGLKVQQNKKRRAA